MRRGWHVLHPGRPIVAGWALSAMCEHLEAVTRGEIKRLLINVPPGCTKSMLVNVFWPAWEWGPLDHGELKYISASHGADLTIHHQMRCRDLIDSEWYQGLWGDRFSWKSDQNAKVHYENSRTGWRFAASVGKGITGRRGDRIIIDDPHNVQDVESEPIREEAVRWFSETLPTRVNDQETTPFVVIMQRVHESDISGHILAKGLAYEHLCLPMEYDPEHPYKSSRFQDPRRERGELLWPERFSRPAVEELKAHFRSWGGTYAEAGQLDQRPAPRGGGMFQRQDFRVIASLPEDDPVLARARGWDLAATASAKAAFTVGVKLARLKSGLVVVEDVVRGQWAPHEVYQNLRASARLDRCRQSIPQDPGQAGKDQARHMAAHLEGADFFFSPESGSKVERAGPLAAQAGVGNLAIIRAEWNDAYVNEACSFPRGAFMDQVDASSRAYAAVVARREQLVGGGPRLVSAGPAAE